MSAYAISDTKGADFQNFSSVTHMYLDIARGNWDSGLRAYLLMSFNFGSSGPYELRTVSILVWSI